MVCVEKNLWRIIMKRSHSSDDAKKRGRITTDMSTSTRVAATTATTAHINKLRKYGTHLRHHSQRGAASASEYMKSDWTSDELDLTKNIEPLSAFVGDNIKFIEQLFAIFSAQELRSLAPDILKDIPLNQLKDLCLEELESIPEQKIKFILDGNKAEDFDKLSTQNTARNDNKQSSTTAANDKSDDIHLSVDDNEYSDFLVAEKASNNKVVMKDVEIQANESSLESSSDSESVSDDNREGWKNIFAKTQMEILELEMRARAIRSLMKAEDSQDIKREIEIITIKEEPLDDDIDIIEQIRDIQTESFNQTEQTVASIVSQQSSSENEIIDDSPNKDTIIFQEEISLSSEESQII